jgi:ribosome-binding factor A
MVQMLATRKGSSRMAGARMRRVNEALREVLSRTLATGLKDPRIGFVTVTGVDTSPDLRTARVYVSVLGEEAERERALAGLRSSRGFLQAQVGELRLKRTPKLEFVYDESIERGMRISQLLDEGGYGAPGGDEDDK